MHVLLQKSQGQPILDIMDRHRSSWIRTELTWSWTRGIWVFAWGSTWRFLAILVLEFSLACLEFVIFVCPIRVLWIVTERSRLRFLHGLLRALLGVFPMLFALSPNRGFCRFATSQLFQKCGHPNFQFFRSFFDISFFFSFLWCLPSPWVVSSSFVRPIRSFKPVWRLQKIRS